MAKKGKKKGISFSDSTNSSSKNDSNITQDESIHKPLSDKIEIPHQFTVLLDHEHPYSKVIKSRNVIFLHPSVIRSYNAPSYFFITGNNNYSLCVAYPMKSVKISTVVFPKDSMCFKHKELVTLHPYTKPVTKATEITVTINNQLPIADDLKEQVLMILGYKDYLCCGMVIKYNYLDYSYDITIDDIQHEEAGTFCDNDSLDVSGFKNHSTSFFNSTNMSLNETIPKKLLSSGVHEGSQCDQSSNQLNSMFSSMCLDESNVQDSELSEHYNQNNAFDQEAHLRTNIPEFYTVGHATSVTFLGNSTEFQETSSSCFSQIGGLKDELRCIKDSIDRFLNSEGNQYELGALLLLGHTGTGKSLTLDAIRQEYDGHVEEIMWYRLYLQTPSEAEKELQQVFQRASDRAPCIILVDDFNYLCPKTNDSQSRSISRMVSHFIERYVDHKIGIIAASNNSEYDSEVLGSGETRVKEIKFLIPTADGREDIFVKLLSSIQHNLSPEEIKQCVMHSQGFTGKDLKYVLNDAVYRRAQNNPSSNTDFYEEVITFTDIKQALKYKKPSIVENNMKIKEVRWNDIGGMKDVKQKLKDLIEGPLKYSENYKRYSTKPCKGILLYGPPGCSKTMIAKALATECDFNFISKNVSDIQNKYVGESEKAVSDLFLLARAKAPCIIFLDEIDALLAERGSSTGSGVEDRIVHSFLKEMDGVEELHSVTIIAATNRPDILDGAFIRSGRVNHYIYIPLPDLEAREEIFKLQMKNRTVADDIDYKYLAMKTEGYSGAEIVNICNEAAFQILSEDIECKSAVFSKRHFEKAIKSLIPRTPIELLEFYKSFNAKFGPK